MVASPHLLPRDAWTGACLAPGRESCAGQALVQQVSIVAPTSDENVFQQLLSEWTGLRSHVGNVASVVAEWSRMMDAAIAEQRHLREQGEWTHGRDDLFGVLRIHRAEVRHSAMLAWLLDPGAKHPLGTRFLAAFLARACPDMQFSRLADARTTCEVSRRECRADVVIELPEAVIVIENKIDAPESDRQCDILYESFSDRPGARFVFLTPTGCRPVSASGEAADAFVAIGHREITAMLSMCLDNSRTDRQVLGRHIVEDYLRTLRKEFR